MIWYDMLNMDLISKVRDQLTSFLLLSFEQYPDVSRWKRENVDVLTRHICRPWLAGRWPGSPGTTRATARGSSAWGRASRWSCWSPGWTPRRTTWWGWGWGWWRASSLSPVSRSPPARPSSSPSPPTVKVGRGREPRSVHCKTITVSVGYKQVLMTDIILCSTKCKHIFET